MRITKKKIAGAVAISTVVALGAGSAYAFWTTTGSGTGSADVGTDTPVTVVQTSTISGLGPGSPAQALSGTFTNPNDFPVTINGLTATVTATDKQNCSAADFVIGGTAVLPANGVIAVDDTSTWSGLNVSMTNTDQNQNACKNAELTISYVVS
jgi:hypothetical protein